MNHVELNYIYRSLQFLCAFYLVNHVLMHQFIYYSTDLGILLVCLFANKSYNNGTIGIAHTQTTNLSSKEGRRFSSIIDQAVCPTWLLVWLQRQPEMNTNSLFISSCCYIDAIT